MPRNIDQRLCFSLCVERWPRKIPFRITGHVFDVVETILVTLEADGFVGRGEAAGVYYRGETAKGMLHQLEAVRGEVERGLTRRALQMMLPPGGARNALDCALWDLEAKRAGVPVWQSANLSAPRPLLSTFTCGAEPASTMAARAISLADARAIKLKLIGDEVDADRVMAVRAARPDVWLCVDANQGFTRATFERLMPVLVNAGVALIEQPFAIGEEALLEGIESPIPIAADESVQSLSDLPDLVGRFDMINIKLDKCGGLTEGLAMAREARTLGLDVMVGCMGGTSLAMAPAYLLGQYCDVVDLDGPISLKADRDAPVIYSAGLIDSPEALWGHPVAGKMSGRDIQCAS